MEHLENLTAHEKEILDYASFGGTHKQIAYIKKISAHTVDNILRKSLEKSGLKSLGELKAVYLMHRPKIRIEDSPLRKQLLAMALFGILLPSLFGSGLDEVQRTKTKTKISRIRTHKNRESWYS